MLTTHRPKRCRCHCGPRAGFGLLEDPLTDFALILWIDRNPLDYALAGCGRQCATLFAQGNGAFPLDTEMVSEAHV